MEWLSCTVEHQPALEQHLFYFGEPNACQRCCLFYNGHVQLVVLHPTLSDEVVAYQIGTTRQEQ